MLQYLVVLLDDTSISYCHNDNECIESNLMPLDILRKGILFGMKENLMIQFVYPNYDIPQEYKEVIESIDHSNIMSTSFTDDADVIVMDGTSNIEACHFNYSTSLVLRLTKREFFEHSSIIESFVGTSRRLNIIIKDIESFIDEDYKKYKDILLSLNHTIVNLYKKGDRPQINLLTDRIMLDSMNNCGAGDTSICLAPDGNFYVCPAFYQVDSSKEYGLGRCKFSIGSLNEGVQIPNSNLYKLDFAPICCECDAFHCKRCIWLNRKLTYEVNTPGKQQCVVAHIERKASMALLKELQTKTSLFKDKNIKDIDYNDPFDKLLKMRY